MDGLEDTVPNLVHLVLTHGFALKMVDVPSKLRPRIRFRFLFETSRAGAVQLKERHTHTHTPPQFLDFVQLGRSLKC